MKQKLDPVQMSRNVYDEDAKANRVKLTDTSIAMELDHKDGDSVTSHPAKLSASAISVVEADHDGDIIPPLDCSSIREVRVTIDGEGAVDVMVSPTDSGPFFYKVAIEDQTVQICARRIKVVSRHAVGDVHLVGRS